MAVAEFLALSHALFTAEQQRKMRRTQCCDALFPGQNPGQNLPWLLATGTTVGYN